MRDRPISSKSDDNYLIKYNEKAKEDYSNYFENEKDDVIFINGKWGSGKTSYLNIVLEENIKKILFFKWKKKIVKTIDLWRITTNQKTTEICYRKIFPITGFLIRYIFLFLFLFFSGGAFLFSKSEVPAFFTGASSNSVNSTIYIFLVSGFLSGLTQILGKIDYDDLYLFFLKKRTKKHCLLRKRIIIIDDFDRITPIRQEELYKIFNLITNKKIKFVFLGEYTTIQKNEDCYLQKIIDRRIELPYELSPSNYWTTYFEEIILKIENKRSNKLSHTEKNNIARLQSELILENRTLREKKMFEKYVYEFLFYKDRYDKVNVDQQLLVIYLYLFHSNHYHVLVSKIDKLLEPHRDLENTSRQQNSEKIDQSLKSIRTTIAEFFKEDHTATSPTLLILDILLRYDNANRNIYSLDYKYADFVQQFPNYLINYIPVNVAGKVVQNMINKHCTRKYFLQKMQENPKLGIYDYIRRNQKQLSQIDKNNIFNLTMDFVINQDYKYFNDINESPIKKEINDMIIWGLHLNDLFDVSDKETAREYLQKNFLSKIDVSAQLQFYDFYLGLALTNVLDCQKEMIQRIVHSETAKNVEYPELIFHYIYQTNKKFTDAQVDQLIELPDKQFYHFISRISYDRGINKIALGSTLSNKQKEKIISRYRDMDKFYIEKLDIKLINEENK